MRLSKPNYILPLFALCQIKRKNKAETSSSQKKLYFSFKIPDL